MKRSLLIDGIEVSSMNGVHTDISILRIRNNRLAIIIFACQTKKGSTREEEDIVFAGSIKNGSVEMIAMLYPLMVACNNQLGFKTQKA